MGKNLVEVIDQLFSEDRKRLTELERKYKRLSIPIYILIGVQVLSLIWGYFNG